MLRVRDLEMSARARATLRALNVGDYDPVSKLAKITDAEFLAVPGCGRGTFDDIRRLTQAAMLGAIEEIMPTHIEIAGRRYRLVLDEDTAEETNT